jgi:hypothetical protein
MMDVEEEELEGRENLRISNQLMVRHSETIS